MLFGMSKQLVYAFPGFYNKETIVLTNLLRDLFEIFDASTNIFCFVYYPTSHRVIMQITSIYMVLQNYLSYEIFNDTIFAIIEKI